MTRSQLKAEPLPLSVNSYDSDSPSDVRWGYILRRVDSTTSSIVLFSMLVCDAKVRSSFRFSMLVLRCPFIEMRMRSPVSLELR